MELIPTSEFLSWARTHEIAPDERYSAPQCLVYAPVRPFHRFWEIPQDAVEIPSFILHLLDGFDPWTHCYLFPRDGWPHDAAADRHGDDVYALILNAAGIPANFDGAVQYKAAEASKLVAAVFAALVFGWSVQDDLFVVPDHSQQLLQTDHHHVVHVQFADEHRVEPFIKHMASQHYLLPTDLPDRTFKRPDWMK